MTSRLFTLVMATAVASTVLARQPAANATVAADGSGTYKTIQAAIDAVPQNTSGSNRWTIFVKAGTYREREDRALPRPITHPGERVRASASASESRQAQ